jgi:hypothetical protein
MGMVSVAPRRKFLPSGCIRIELCRIGSLPSAIIVIFISVYFRRNQMKTIIKFMALFLVLVNSAVSYALEIEGYVGTYLTGNVDIDGDSNTEPTVAISIVDASVSECDVAYVGTDLVWVELDGNALSESTFSAAVSAAASAAGAGANYTVNGTTGLCILDEFAVSYE